MKYVHIPDGKAARSAKQFASMSCRILTHLYRFSAVYNFALDKQIALKASHRQSLDPMGSAGIRRIHTNTVESAFSLLKRGLIGSFHRVSIKHLHRYLSEFEFRFNIRKDDRQIQRAHCGAWQGSRPCPTWSLSRFRRARLRDYRLFRLGCRESLLSPASSPASA